MKRNSAVDALMDEVQWKKEDEPESNPDNVPYVTHSGVLSIAGFDFRVVQLNTGERIFPEEELTRFFRAMGGDEAQLPTP